MTKLKRTLNALFVRTYPGQIVAGQFNIAPNPAPAPNKAESPSVTPKEAKRQISKGEISPEIERMRTFVSQVKNEVISC